MPYITNEEHENNPVPPQQHIPMVAIPAHDDLEFKLKTLCARKPAIILPPAASALYIGSGPSINSVRHMLPLVDASTYVLADMAFDAKDVKTVQYKDCAVRTTDQDGYEIIEEAAIKKDRSIGVIMVDQVAFDGMPAAYRHINNGTFILVHTFDPEHPWLDPFLHTRIGLAHQHGNLLYKTSSVDASVIEAALERNTLIRSVDAFGDVSGGVNKHLSFSKYSAVVPGHTFIEAYEGEGFVKEAQELVTALNEQALNHPERKALRANVAATIAELGRKPCRAHDAIATAFKRLL